MSTLSESEQPLEARAVEIISAGLRILTARDGIIIPEALVEERARNVVTALQGEFELVPRGPVAELVRDLRRSVSEFVSAVNLARDGLGSEIA